MLNDLILVNSLDSKAYLCTILSHILIHCKALVNSVVCNCKRVLINYYYYYILLLSNAVAAVIFPTEMK